MNIGIVVAVEMKAFIRKYGYSEKIHNLKKFKVYEYNFDECNIYIISSGAGLIAASIATQVLILTFELDLIINFGVVGSAKDSILVGDTCIVENVVHYNFDISDSEKNYKKGMYFNNKRFNISTTNKYINKALFYEPSLKKVICGSGDKFIGKENEKRNLSRLYDIDIIDMEAAGIVLTCLRNGIDCFLIKTVSDGVKDGIGTFEKTIDKTSDICVNFLDKILFR